MLNLEDGYYGDGGIRDIIRAKMTSNWDALTEASLNRVSKHIEGGHFGVITSWRGEHSDDANKDRFKKFRKDVIGAGYGFVRMIGHGEVEKGVSSNYKEHSLFIPGKGSKGPLSLHKMTHWAHQHDQESFIYSGPETEHVPHLVSMDKTRAKTDAPKIDSMARASEYNPTRLGDYHSRLLAGRMRKRDKRKETPVPQGGASDTNAKSTNSKHAFSFKFEGYEVPVTVFAGAPLEVELPFVAWEYLPERTISQMRSWDIMETRIATELGIAIGVSMESIEEKLNSRMDDIYEIFSEDYR
jgi:hypothetical protein